MNAELFCLYGVNMEKNRVFKLSTLAISLVIGLSACGSDHKDTSVPASAGSHVPSPDWRDQIIYFLMIDRFNDGDTANDDQGANEYDPSSEKKFSGGDLVGVQQKIDYIQGLGATAVWTTPPVANQWWDPAQNYGGYHGYWARDLQKVDEHFGDLQSYQALAKGLHAQGMYLIQDVVVNHLGNFFTYTGNYDPANPCQGFELIPGALAAGQSLPAPLAQNDCNNASDFSAAIYHWTPAIKDHNDTTQELTYQLSDLDDLNTSTPAVRDYLKQSYRYWIDQVGVDAFRVDTVKFVDHDFYYDFFHAPDGILAEAKKTGRNDFLSLGEIFEASTPYHTEGEEKLIAYLGSQEKPELASVLNFPLQSTMSQVFAGGKPTAELGFRLRKMMTMYPDPYRLGNFIENHDMARLLSQGNPEDLKQALFTMLTLPGIPVIYQGTEQAFTGYRDSMFAGGYREDGQHIDSFDSQSTMYQFIQQLAQLRHNNKVLSRGDLTILAEDKAGAGAFAYRRHLDDAEALVILNTANQAVLLNQMATGLPAGTRLTVLSQLNGETLSSSLVTGENGTLTLALPAKSALLLESDGSGEQPPVDSSMTLATELADQTLTADLPLTGTGTPGSTISLVVDGELQSATQVVVGNDGQWHSTLSIRHFAMGTQDHRLALYNAAQGSSLADINFQTQLAYPDTPSVTVDDSGDGLNGSAGPLGSYSLPQDDSFDKTQSQLAIEEAKLYHAGSNVRLSLKMAKLTDTWVPTNGFDHVGFSIFMHLPEQAGGATVLPKIQASMPDGETWQRQVVAFGWQNSLYSSEGATDSQFGKAISPAPTITVDKSSNTINFDFPSASLGRPASLNGIKFYITTWDLDGLSSSYRPLQVELGPWNFAGGTDQDPRVWDDTPLLNLSE
jgi:glycosidase